MKRTILALSLSLACAVVAYAQKTETQATGDAGTSARLSHSDPAKRLCDGALERRVFMAFTCF